MKVNYTIPIILVLTLSTVVLIGKYAGLRVEYLKSEREKSQIQKVNKELQFELEHSCETIQFLQLDNSQLTEELNEKHKF